MSILLLVVVLLVIAIVLSRLTWASQLGERRSIKHHEQAMDVLRSVAGRPEDSEGADHGAYAAAHVKSAVENGAGFPAPAARRAVPETSVQREETIRILRSERPEASPAGPSSSEPAPPRVEPAEPPPSWEPAHVPHGQPNGEGQPAKPAFVFLDDDSRPGPVTLPPDVAAAVRGRDAGRLENGGGGGDDPGGADGVRSGNGHRWEDDPAAAHSVLPSPPTIGDHAWAGPSRSEARSRSRARTRSWLWGRLLAPFQATGRAASGARDRLGARRSPAEVGAGVDATHEGSETRLMTAVAEPPTAESVKVVGEETAEVATVPRTEADGPTGHGEDGASVTTAPVPGVPASSSPVDEGLSASGGIGGAALDAVHAPAQWVTKLRRSPRFGLGVGLAAILVVACVLVGVLVATMSTSSNNGQPARAASPPPSTTAPAAPASPLTQVSRDDQGAWYNVNTSRLSVSAVATGRVWLEVVAGTGPNGPVLFQGILNDGQTQTFTNNAPVWMRIGASSNVNVTVNGNAVQLPQNPNTFNLAFTH
ncbi:MAG TPA: RodZ domain-containing protein [Acidimicrobiales bacterium]|nr:RodZ domain-containing protein [Acidimicrobiales bacterium]